MLGLYDILERITEKYQDVLIEGCSSGGARFDPGMLYYVPQNWTSDNTDAFDRATIQRGYSLLYPQITMECLVILKFRMKIILHGRLFLRREKNAKLLSCRNCLIRDILMEEFISVV